MDPVSPTVSTCHQGDSDVDVADDAIFVVAQYRVVAHIAGCDGTDEGVEHRASRVCIPIKYLQKQTVSIHVLRAIPTRRFGSRSTLQLPIELANSVPIHALIHIKHVHSSPPYQKAIYQKYNQHGNESPSGYGPLGAIQN